MQSTRITQAVIILLICGLIAFIFFNGKNNPSALLKNDSSHAIPGQMTQQKAGEPFNFDLYTKDVLKQLPSSEAAAVSKLEQEMQSAPSQKTMLALAEKYDKLQRPALAGYYYLRLAQARKTDESAWAMAGKEYFQAQAMFAGTPPYAYFVDESIKAYDKALELNPKDLDSKANQAVNYFEGKQEVMKGVGMLREIIQVDSNNRSALLYLGILSMQSQQVDKAIKRFERLVELEPSRSDYHRYLGEAYLQAGRKEEARKELLKFKSMIHDDRLKAEVDQMLSTINN